jgi:A/G-specific adenine glycosylase
MDYGTMLKESIGNYTVKSKMYTKQSKFAGSDRQIRGKLLSLLLEGKRVRMKSIITYCKCTTDRAGKVVGGLMEEGFIVREKGGWYSVNAR